MDRASRIFQTNGQGGARTLNIVGSCNTHFSEEPQRRCTHAKLRTDMHVHAFSETAKGAYPVVKLVHICIFTYFLQAKFERPLAK